MKDILPQYHLNVGVVVDKSFNWLQMWKPVLENRNVNGFGTNAQTVFEKRRNPKKLLMVVEFGKHVHFALLRRLKPFTIISSFWPVKFKRCARPAETHEWVQQESHITRAMITFVCELISNRST